MASIYSIDGETVSPIPIKNAVVEAPRSGIHAALWIPLDATGKLRVDLLERHLVWLKAKGLHGILALGSTGEFARMSYHQREEILASIVEIAAPLPVIANISSIQLDEVISLGRAALNFGAVGVALMPPSFFPLDQTDILEFFLRAAEKINLPFYLYNYPEVTGNRIGVETIAAFAEKARMVGIKQSGNELSYHKDLIRLGREKDFAVFTASDTLLAKFLDMGAAGCLGGLGNFVPEYMLNVYNACREGRSAEVAETSARLKQIGDLLAPLCLPLNVRSGLEARGFDPGILKSVVSEKTLTLYRDTIHKIRCAYSEWGLPTPELAGNNGWAHGRS